MILLYIGNAPLFHSLEHWFLKIWDYIAFDKVSASLNNRDLDDYLFTYTKWYPFLDYLRKNGSLPSEATHLYF